MLDSDLAKLFDYSTKDLNRNVKNNKDRFPENYCFQLTEEEYKSLRCNFFTIKNNGRGEHRKYLPYVFTEHGVTMLAGILKSRVAVKMSLKIVDAFVTMKKYISSNLLEQKFINNMVLEHDEKIKLLENNFSNKTFSNEIFYEGQIYDAYSLLLDIFNTSNDSIIIIDNYADKNLFDLLSKTKKKVTIYSKNIDDNLIKKYNKQYDNVTLIHNESYHDRFIIIDNKVLYHCGASFKDLGSKCFAINKINNIEIVRDLLSRINYK